MHPPRCTLLLLAVAATGWINTPSAWSQNLTDAWVEKAAGPLVESRVVDGLSIGYIEGKHYGMVHLGKSNAAGKKPDNLSVYEIGSISKVFTGLLLADAVVRGEIELDAAAEVANPAGIRLPSRDGAPIKWIDLSTHRAGLPKIPDNLLPDDLKNPYRRYDSKKAAAFFKQFELPREPGKSYEYSNLGASVLGYLVAQKAGKSYQELLRERIAEPLKMTDCSVSLSSDQKKRFATPHTSFGTATTPWTFSDMPGVGGIHATMRDMMRFAKAQLTPPAGKLGEAIELAWKQQCDADASGPAMGLGWLISGDGMTRGHSGQTGGSHAAVFINREFKSAVVVLCNTAETTKIDLLATALIQKAAGVEAEPKASETADKKASDDKKPADKKPADVAIDAKLRGRLVGRYQLLPTFIFDVRDVEGRLMVGITNQPTVEVFPDSATRWSYRGVAATLEFNLPKTGPAKSLILHQNGAQQTAKRIN